MSHSFVLSKGVWHKEYARLDYKQDLYKKDRSNKNDAGVTNTEHRESEFTFLADYVRLCLHDGTSEIRGYIGRGCWGTVFTNESKVVFVSPGYDEFMNPEYLLTGIGIIVRCNLSLRNIVDFWK